MTRQEYSVSAANDDDLKARPTKPAFGYYGAKHRISSSLIELFPPHNAWVEVFCGSAAITLAKPPVPIEVINDLDSNVVNFFRQLRTSRRRLIEAVELTPYSRKEFEEAKVIRTRDSQLERARKFLVVSMMTINATTASGSCGFSYSSSYTRNGVEARVSRWNNISERISRVVERLKNVRVENKDARAIVEMFSDRPATLLYLDPPYFAPRRHNYPLDERDRRFHEELLDLCCRSKAMIVISNYDNRLYQKYLNRNTEWKRKLIRTKTRDTEGRDFERVEVLWMNRQFVKAKETDRVPIRLSKKERHNQKVNPPR